MHMRSSVKQLVLTKILSRHLFHGNAEDCLFLIILFIAVSLAFFILRVHIAANKISNNCAYFFLTSIDRQYARYCFI